ncbi:MAG: Gx transporter family protein [Candidatus Latescibacterota bacterium]|nr:Gx transporter family protein [Candidatus Latescibacterota bacterium]MEE2627724.1 Gx transporter family protein [Candidatus Latescibacterota bacterium]MEE2728130.1 Gx transporter family protein [Candidatus Latescibacterota bacterium]
MENSTRRLTRIGLLAAAAVVLFVFEGLAPRPLPWMKLGLGNLPVMLALMGYGPLAALAVSVLKLFIGGLLSGSLANPAFFIGAGAGMCSWLVMSAAWALGRSIFSAVGLGIWGAVTHQLAQLALAYIYIGQWGIWTLLPVALLGGLISGILIGLLAHWVHDRSV